jgi:hypothetical protein
MLSASQQIHYEFTHFLDLKPICVKYEKNSKCCNISAKFSNSSTYLATHQGNRRREERLIDASNSFIIDFMPPNNA